MGDVNSDESITIIMVLDALQSIELQAFVALGNVEWMTRVWFMWKN